MNDKKCIWSGRKSENLKRVRLKSLDRFTTPIEKTFYVLPEHEQELRKFNDRFVNYSRNCLYGIIGLTLLTVAVSLAFAAFSISKKLLAIAIGLILFAMGTLIIVFPFATPETVQWLGIRKSKITVRILGLSTVALGMTIAFIPNL